MKYTGINKTTDYCCPDYLSGNLITIYFCNNISNSITKRKNENRTCFNYPINAYHFISHRICCCPTCKIKYRKKYNIHIFQEYLEISWTYEDIQPTIKSVIESDLNLVIPPESELREIFEALDVGDFSAIKQEAQRIQQLAPQYQSFAMRLLALTRTFDEQEILNLLKQSANSEHSV